MTESLVERLVRLDKEAKWSKWHVMNERFIVTDQIGGEPIIELTGDEGGPQRAEFIAAMRNALPELLRLVEAAQDAKRAMEHHDSPGDPSPDCAKCHLADALRPLVERPTESQT